MHFSDHERLQLLAIKGVGATVLARLEQMGFHSLQQLQGQDAGFITKKISEMMGSTCWHNSPQARAAIVAIIALAQTERV